MEAASRSSRGFDDDDEDEEAGQRECSAQSHKLGELSVKFDGKNSGDQQLNTPRSKHSATEQRRRSKINDRFQILRELMPHSDQKRDKASFLLEVIEYIRFLQEKVQKYESAYPEWNQDTARPMPWDKVYYRSIWKNAQNNYPVPGDGIGDPSQVMRNGATPPGFEFSGKPDESSIPVAPLHSSTLNPMESDNMSVGVSYREMENPSVFANNIASQTQSQCPRSSGLDNGTVSNDMLNEQELMIDEGTITVSSVYSQGLLTTLTQALQSSGVDLSQANIAVQINVGKRAASKRLAMTTIASEKDHDNSSSGNRTIEHSRMGSSGEESEHASKRSKPDSS